MTPFDNHRTGGPNKDTAVELTNLVSPAPSHARDGAQKGSKRAGSSPSQTKLWITDIVAWVIAFGFLMSIVGVLKHWNNRPLTEWTFGITLNALISILATLLYTFLMVPVASCIAQLKWNCVHRPRPLYDFSLIDAASKSTFASAKLVFTKPFLVLPAIGAFTTLAVQAVGPFIQQIILQDYTTTPVGKGSLQIANRVGDDFNPATPWYGGANGALHSPVDMPTSAAFYNGIFTTQYVDYNSSILPTCSTTNCTWSDPYYSFEICSSCKDVDHYIVHWYYNETGEGGYNPAVNITLANGHMLQSIYNNESSIFPFMNMSSTLDSIAFINSSGTLLDFSVINFDPVGNKTSAMECVLRVCAQGHVSSLNRSLFSEAKHGEPLYPTDISGRWPWAYYHGDLPDSAFLISPPNSDSSFSMAPMLATGYANFLGPLFINYAGYMTAILDQEQAVNGFAYSSVVAQPLFDAINSTNVSLSLPILMDNIARSLTVHLRTTTNGIVSGTEWSYQLHYKASWAWITLPTLMLVATLVLLIATAVDTHVKGLGVWRTSTLATMLHGLDDGGRLLTSQSNDVNDMEEESKEVDVSMVTAADGTLMLRATRFEE